MRKFDATSSSRLPRLFDIKKYDGCINWGISDWYNNLSHRRLRRADVSHATEDQLSQIQRTADRLLMDPLFPSRELREGDGYIKNVYQTQVRDQTAFELVSGHWTLEIWSELAAEYQGALNTLREEMYGDAKYDEAAHSAYERLNVPAWKMWAELGIRSDGEVSVKVDLFASEEKLMNDFRAWLRDTRAKLNIPTIKSRFTSSDFEKWRQGRILAYLDLTFWADVNSRTLTNQDIGVALFPDEYDVNLAERIRKVISPMAQAASSVPYLEAMLSQALAEKKDSN